MTSSFVSGVGTAMTSVWRVHTQLDESDEPDSSPVAPNKFRKLRSSSSLNSLRMSLRKRLPLRSVQSADTDNTDNPSRGGSLEPNSKTNVVRHLTRTAKNSITGAYQVNCLHPLLLQYNTMCIAQYHNQCWVNYSITVMHY